MCVSFVLTIVFDETFVGSTADIMYIRFFRKNKYEVVNIPVHDNANKTHNSVSDNLCKQSWVTHSLFSWRAHSHLTQIKKLAELQKSNSLNELLHLKEINEIIVIHNFTPLYITKPNSTVSKICLEALLLDTLNSCVD